MMPADWQNSGVARAFGQTSGLSDALASDASGRGIYVGDASGDPVVAELLRTYGAGPVTSVPGIPFNDPNLARNVGAPNATPQNWSPYDEAVSMAVYQQKWAQNHALDRAHYQQITNLPMAERFPYLRALVLTDPGRGITAQEFDESPFWHAANFLHEAHRRMGAPRDRTLADSDAALIFGLTNPNPER